MVTIKLRRDLEAEWRRVNPVLENGEPGYETDTGLFKIGDGETRWLELKYFTPGDRIPDSTGVDEVSLLAHINSLSPHPVYDDGPSLLLLYQNAKV